MLGYVYTTVDYIVNGVHFVLLCGVATLGIFLWYKNPPKDTQ